MKIKDEFNYISLSSSKRDEDNLSDFDQGIYTLVHYDRDIICECSLIAGRSI